MMTQYDTTPKKLKKDKKLGLKLDKKTSQNLKTGALFKADNNNAFSSTFSGRFETIKTIANKRTPTTTPLLVNPTLRNPKHAAVLAESDPPAHMCGFRASVPGCWWGRIVCGAARVCEVCKGGCPSLRGLSYAMLRHYFVCRRHTASATQLE